MKLVVKTRAEIRDEAITIGSRIINDKGVRGLSLRAVAGEIGYTVGSLYNVFENQEDFLRQINARTLEELYQFILYQLEVDKTFGIERLRTIAHSYIHFAQNKYQLWRLLFDDNLISSAQTPAWYMEQVNKLFELIENALLAANYNIENSREHVCTLWSGVHGICSLALSGKLYPAWLNNPLILIDNLINNYTIGIANHEIIK